MNLTPEQEALVLSKLGYKPYEAKLVVGPDGVDIVETPTEDRGWKDSAALIGTRIPRELAATAGGLWGAARVEPAALKMAGLGAKIPGPAPLKGVGSFLGHMAVSAPAFAAANSATRKLYDESSVSKMIDNAAFPSTAQKFRAETEHPWIAHGADLASNLLMFQLNNPAKVVGALAKLLRPGMLARGELGAITEAEREILRNTGRNAAAGGIMAAGSDIANGEKPALDRIGTAMVENAFFGLPRSLSRKVLAPFTTAQEAAQKSKGLPERFPPVPQEAPAQTPEGFVPDLMKPAAPSIMGEQPPVIKPAPDIMGTRPDLMVQPEFQPFARQAEPHDYPPFNPDDPIGLNVARASGTLAQQMAAARERGPMGRSTAELYNRPELPPGFAGPSTAEPHAFGPQTPELYNQPEVPPGFARTSSGEPAPYGPPNNRQLQYFLENLDLTPKLSKPPVRETTATDYDPQFPAPGRTEAEILQDQLEGNNVRYQAAKKNEISLKDPVQEVEVVGAGLGGKEKYPVYTPTPSEERQAFRWYQKQQARAQAMGIEPDFADHLIAKEGDMLLMQGKFAGGAMPESNDSWISKAREYAKQYAHKNGEIIEGNGIDVSAYQPTQGSKSASPLDVEREALRRRGLSFEETDDTIHMPDGGVASGQFDRSTGKIRVSMPHVQEDTHVHEGMHAEINDMLKSDNPKVRAAGQRIMDAMGNLEETLVEGATATSRGSRGQNELVRAVKDAWNYFRTTKLGGSDMTPERAARLLAERFDYGRPSEFKGGGTGVAHQPFLQTAIKDHEGKPMAFYHGTVADFNIFRPGTEGEFGKGIYLTPDPEIANRYVNHNAAEGESRSGPGKLYKTYVSLKKPLDITPQSEIGTPIEILQKLGLSRDKAIDVHEKALEKRGNLTGEISKLLQKQGYDGLIIRAGSGKIREVVAMDPRQIKSATGNSGTFDETNPDIRYQPFVPGSVVGKAGKENPVVGRALLDMATARDQLHGMVNSELEALSQLPRDVVNSMAWKRSRAGQFKTKPEFTPEEQRANDIYQRIMDITAREATKHGYPIEQMANYVPEMAGVDQARAYEDAPKVTELLTKFHDLNSKIHGNFYNPVKGEEYLRQYLSGVRRAPNSMGSDFGALTKDARQYHLPDEFREYDQLRNLQRYVNRWSTGVAKKAHILNNPAVADALGYNGKIKHESGAMAEPELSGAMQNAKMFIEDTLFNQGRGTSGIGQNVRDVIMGGQQVVNAATMQTLSNLKNTLAKVPMHLINAQNLDQAAAVMRGALEPVLNYNLARERAMKMNVIRPNVDPAFDTSAPLGTQVARKLSELGTKLRKYTASQFLEEFNRAQDFAIGKQLAETNIKLAESGDKDALRFLDQFDYGKGGDRIDNIARNYAKAIQGTYSGEGLPAAMVKGGAVGTIMRIQRYGIENFNRTRQMVIEPARNGEYGPLLTYTLGLALTAPAIIKLQELFSGRPSGLPTDEEIKAGKNTELVEKTLNLMTMAQIAGAFGYAGNVAGSVAQNARGNPQALVGDPSVSFTADLLKNLAMAAGAVHNGEPVVPVLEEVFKRSVIDHMQLLRGLTTDRELAKDTRNKRVFEQQNGTRDVNGAQIATGLMLGDLGSDRTPKISPTFEAAKKGDPEAIAKLSPREQALLDNYKGGYEDEDREYAYQAYLLKSQGPEALKAYIQRRVDAIHQRAPR